jgi:hypothetical protein
MEILALIIRVVSAIIKALSFCWIFLWTSFVVILVCSFLNRSMKILEYFENEMGIIHIYDGLELTLLEASTFVLPPTILLVVIWFVERAVYGFAPNKENGKDYSSFSYFTKWLASIFAGVVSGVAVWALTNRI